MACKLIVCVAAVSALSLAGCGKKASAKTPRELMSNLQHSVVAKDKDLFIGCTDAVADQPELVGCSFEMISSMTDLHDALVRQYGKDAVKDDNNGLIRSDRKWLDELLIQEEFGKATVTDKAGHDLMELVRTDDVWKVHAGSLVGHGPKEAQALRELSKTVVDAARQGKANIGKNGYDAARIQKEFSEAMRAHLMRDIQQGA